MRTPRSNESSKTSRTLSHAELAKVDGGVKDREGQLEVMLKLLEREPAKRIRFRLIGK
jgi:hypothetical protein